MQISFMLSAGAEIGEIVDDIRDQVEALGHEFHVSRGQFLPPPWVNVFSEGVPESALARIIPIVRQGYRLVVLVSEMPTLVTREGLVWNYWTSDTWLLRSEEFIRAASHFTAAWCYVPGAAESIRQFCPRAIDVDIAWGRRFDKPHQLFAPVHDFCFYGRMTPRRENVLNAFVQKGHSVDVIPFTTPIAQRDQRLLASKVVVDVKQHDWWPVASCMRYLVAVGLGRPVVAESRGEAEGAWRNIARFAPDGQFYETATAVLHNWKDIHAMQLSALRAKPGTLANALAILP